ncbi:MAG: hypothetical protein WD894_08300 [Pirellulales bacterium]
MNPTVARRWGSLHLALDQPLDILVVAQYAQRSLHGWLEVPHGILAASTRSISLTLCRSYASVWLAAFTTSPGRMGPA